ncbi:MAG: GNAT family N-acetyltransferase [Bacteroidia bacterium]|nr:GNAT family N-acetyltransferase [Bacteroidia bacterium]
MSVSFSPFPVLKTPRMTLRQIVPEDAPEMFALRSDERVMKYIDRPRSKTLEDALTLIHSMEENRLKNEGIAWAMCLHDDPRMIGNIGYWRTQLYNFRAEIGYMLHPDFHRKGLTSEAMKVVMDFGFKKMNLHSIEAHINPGNDASAQLLEKHRFVREAYFRENYFFEGQFLDTAVYSLLCPK